MSIITESEETAVQSGRGRGGKSFSPSSAGVVRGLRSYGVINMKPCVGDWVEVRSKEEILRTLDQSGRLEGLPFMPQMFQYCGQRFQVYKRAHKTCDTVSGHWVGRSLLDGVHLNLRCDGQAYDGCQAACLIFWKSAWLKPLTSEESPQRPSAANERRSEEAVAGSACVEDDVWRATRHGPPGEETKYTCQATELLHFTSPLKWRDVRQYVETYRSGNASMRQILGGLFHAAYCIASLANWPRVGRPARWLYDRSPGAAGGDSVPQTQRADSPWGADAKVRSQSTTGRVGAGKILSSDSGDLGRGGPQSRSLL